MGRKQYPARVRALLALVLAGLAAFPLVGESLAGTASRQRGTRAATAHCASSQLRLSSVRIQAASYHEMWDLALANTGVGICSLRGYPTVKLLDRHGRPSVASHDASGYAVHTVFLAPGQRAFFTFNYPGGGPCGRRYTAYGVDVFTPGNHRGLVLHRRPFTVCSLAISYHPYVTPVRARLNEVTACSNETVRVFGKPTILRFALQGVSCSQAHGLIRTYFRTATIQSCRGHGNACILDFPGGWACSFLIATEGPGYAGCFRSQSERFKVFRVTRHKGSQLHVSAFLSPDRKIWCVLQDGSGIREADCFYDANRFAGGQEYAALLRPNGRLVTCAWRPTQPAVGACVQNWNPSAPVLKSGRVDVIYQYRCRAASAAITCAVDTGKGKGKGFTISGTGVTPIP